jgi:hypothetical protein
VDIAHHKPAGEALKACERELSLINETVLALLSSPHLEESVESFDGLHPGLRFVRSSTAPTGHAPLAVSFGNERLELGQKASQRN